MSIGPARAAKRPPSPRIPFGPKGAAEPRPPPPGDRPLLRLTVSRGVLAVELDAPFSLGPIAVAALRVDLPSVRFPVDLSGGVSRFRHRRGALSLLSVEVSAADLAAWAAPSLRGILSADTPDVMIAPVEHGAIVGLCDGRAALAFDVVIAPREGDLLLIPERARGIGLGQPPHVAALRALSAIVTSAGRVRGGAAVLPLAAQGIARHVLPDAGARAPDARNVRWDVAAPSVGRWSIEARSGAAPPALGDRALRALELLGLAEDADEASFRGDFERARDRYLACAERAPRHPEIAERLAWLDVVAGGRADGALSTVVEVMPAVHAGVLGGALLEAVGDRDGAYVALARGAEIEPVSALAALAWTKAADLADTIGRRIHALDCAIARAPSLAIARWARLEARLERADLRGARADADHLEAAARGASAKHAVWRRAASAMLDRGMVAEAADLFERALRYAPDDAEATLGLARSLRAAGRDRRALDLFARSAALSARAGEPSFAAEIELCRGLAEVTGDRSAAVARARAIPPGVPEAIEARFLEGKYRAEIGDLAGAAVAFGRLRDAVEIEESLMGADRSPAIERAASIARMLAEAAAIEEDERGDRHAAQRDLGLAMRLAPRDRSIAASFRRVAALLVSAAQKPATAANSRDEETPTGPIEPAHVGPAHVDRVAHIEPVRPVSAPFEPPPLSRDPAEDEASAAALTDRVRADPTDRAAVMQLIAVLERLGRDLDLLALVSARMEEDAAMRGDLAPKRREILRRLASTARHEGRSDEADLYEMMANEE